MEESHNNYAGGKEGILYDSIYIKFQKMQTNL